LPGEVARLRFRETVTNQQGPNLTFSRAVAIAVETALFVRLVVDVLVE